MSLLLLFSELIGTGVGEGVNNYLMESGSNILMEDGTSVFVLE